MGPVLQLDAPATRSLQPQKAGRGAPKCNSTEPGPAASWRDRLRLESCRRSTSRSPGQREYRAPGFRSWAWVCARSRNWRHVVRAWTRTRCRLVRAADLSRAGCSRDAADSGRRARSPWCCVVDGGQMRCEAGEDRRSWSGVGCFFVETTAGMGQDRTG